MADMAIKELRSNKNMCPRHKGNGLENSNKMYLLQQYENERGQRKALTRQHLSKDTAKPWSMRG